MLKQTKDGTYINGKKCEKECQCPAARKLRELFPYGTEVYVVEFMVKEFGSCFVYREEIYHANKDEHDKVKARWKNDYRHCETKLMSVVQCR